MRRKERKISVTQNFYKKLKNVKPKTWLIFILIFGLFLRLIFFMGFVNADAQDEGIYINYIHHILKGDFGFSSYRNLPSDYLADPSESFRFRSMLLYPVTLTFLILGVNDFTAVLYIMFTSLGSIIVIFYLGKLVFDERVGLMAAFLLSFFPLNVLFATRIMPDVPLAFFMSLTVYFFLRGETSKKKNRILKINENRFYYLLSGLALGLGYLVKPLAFALLPFLFMYMIYKRKFKPEYIFILLGFLMILIPEGVYYYNQSGNFLLNFIIARSQYLNKYAFEHPRSIDIVPKILRLWYVDGEPIYHSKVLLGLFHHRLNVNYFGYFYYFVIISILYLLIKKVKKSYFLILWLFLLFLYLEFGPVGIRTDDEAMINYLFIFKNARFATILTIPSLLILSYFISSVPKKVSIIIISILLISSIYYINKSRTFFVVGIQSIRDVSSFLKSQPKKTIYTDYLAEGMLQYYFGFERDQYIKNIDYQNLGEIEDAFIVDGGSRGSDVCSTVVEDFHKKLLKNLPENWQIIKLIPNPIKIIYPEALDVTVYYAP